MKQWMQKSMRWFSTDHALRSELIYEFTCDLNQLTKKMLMNKWQENDAMQCRLCQIIENLTSINIIKKQENDCDENK